MTIYLKLNMEYMFVLLYMLTLNVRIATSQDANRKFPLYMRFLNIFCELSFNV